VPRERQLIERGGIERFKPDWDRGEPLDDW
jgi:hypothetical protein